MKVLEELPEPEWILDRSGSGHMFWRRESPEYHSRVKFRVDVEIKEFQRGDHELEDVESSCVQQTNNLTMGLTCVICIAVTVMLPWYIIIGIN